MWALHHYGNKDSRPKKLKEQCSGWANSYGRICLERLRKGLFPVSHKTWPEQEVKVAEDNRYKVRTKLRDNKRKREESPVEQEAASSSNGPATYEDVGESREQRNSQGAGEEFEQALVWQGLDDEN